MVATIVDVVATIVDVVVGAVVGVVVGVPTKIDNISPCCKLSASLQK